ncbi:hypothetical protein SSPO_026640 [Streptomyces antimycoticus]|uniref:Uncharacterized protein n=1 Tax=Streptomyces antimycoticus TaxID=68175 RepID=A0A499UTX1_9ACTN|nr:hypothetical protein [Streptomyces antimycoticus]BBJ39946.1 hypothetical protein SSPO_026640 [Streptomyces antimycoticus]
MIDYRKATVPVWTLATRDVQVPAVIGDGPMTAERLGELRGALAALADQPIATLEAHPLPDKLDRSQGIPLDAVSPLAQHLSQLVTESAKVSATAAKATATGETLYRMVIPAKVAAEWGQGLLRPMAPKGSTGEFYCSLVRSTTGRIAASPKLVPVTGAAAAGTVGGAGATAGAAAAGGTVLTVAAPLVLMAVAVGVSAHADRKRQQAIEHITDLLEQLQADKLDDEHSALNGCRPAIDKATAILLDQGKLGVSLGLDSAVHAIDTALSKADIRLARWRSALDKLPAGEPVEIATLTESFPGVDDQGGTFRTHVELAALATALKRRVNVLQAVERAQSEPDNLFENFARALKDDERRLDELESGIASVLVRLSTLELARPNSKRPVFTTGEVDRLLRAAYQIRRLGDGVALNGRPTDVAIEIARDRDGSVVVFPALPAQV